MTLSGGGGAHTPAINPDWEHQGTSLCVSMYQRKSKGWGTHTYRGITELSDPQPLNPYNKPIFTFIQEIDKPTVPPLEHTPVGKEKISLTDL